MSLIKDLMLGLAAGDALGVPFETDKRSFLKENPVSGMTGSKTCSLPPGTWSDDTSMCLAFMSSFVMEHGSISMFKIMREYANYLYEGRYTPFGQVFGVGRTTAKAVEKFMQGNPPLTCGSGGENDLGNGALMRLAPIVPILKYRCANDELRYSFICDFTAMTHCHRRCFACALIYCYVALELIENKDNVVSAVLAGAAKAKALMEKNGGYGHEFDCLKRIFDGVKTLDEDEISSSGYVVDTLEAALWCLVNTDSYSSCVLKAVNLGGDTDTIAAVAGSLAGIIYGADSIPAEWIDTLAKKDELLKLMSEYKNTLELKA